MSKFDLGRRAVRAGLLAAVSAFAVNSAHATLVNTIPGGTVVTPPNNGGSSTSFFSSTGPFQIGTGVGRDIVWTSNSPSAVGGYSSGYGLCSNGGWNGSPPYFGTNSVINADTMTFTFNDGDVSSVGGFMSWGRGCFGAVNFTIEARNASNSLLESHSFNFATSGATNSGEFWAIERATADIRSFVVYGSFVVLRNFTFLTAAGCPVGAGDDTCLIDSATNQATAIDADGHATGDTLQVGGPTDFNFNVAGIGTTYTNFEVFQKVEASNVTLTGTAGVAANWQVLAGTLTASGGNAIFDTSNVDVSSGATFALSNNETIGSLTGAAGSFVTLGANTLTTGGDNSSTTFAGLISGVGGGLTKTGSGTMTLTGANSYSGATSVNAGALRITNATALGTTEGGTTVADGAALELQGGVSVGAEALTLNGTGIANGGALRNLSGNNTYAGPITLGSASRINSDANSLGITGAVNNGGFLLTVGGAGATTFSGAAVISGAGGLTKDGTGTASLFMANTYMGVTTVNDGVLQITGGNAIVDTGAVVVNAPGQLQVFASESIGSLASNGSILISGGSTLTTGLDNTNTTFLGVISEQLGSAILIKQGTGNFTLSGANTYTGPTNVNGGTLTLAGGSAIANTGAVTVAGGATLALSASEQIGSLAGAGTLSLGANTLTTGGASNTSFTGTTSGAGGITKVGTGKFSTGALANTGTNTINAGEMNVNGNVAGSVVVNSGGTLSGTNTIAGSLTLNAGGTLKTGNSPGITNVAGNYIGGGSMSVEVQFNNAGAPVNGTTHDFLNVTGNVTNVTTISIVPFAPSTAPVATVGNGIELVRVGGTTASGAFALAGPVIQGGYEYVLKYLADYSGTLDGYFLQSGVRQEIAAISGAAMGSSALGAACSSAESRIDAAKNSRRHGWATGNFGSLETDADSGLVSDGDSTCVNTGMTFASGLPGVNMGFSLSLGSYDGTLSLIGGASTLEGSRFGAEAIVSYAKDMFFVTAAAGFANQDFEFKGSLLQSTGGASGLTANVAAGVRVPVAGIAELTLAGVFDYNDAVCRDACFGFASYSEGDAIMTGTIKGMVNASFGPFSPYAGLSYSTVMSDDAAPVLGAPVASFTGDGMVAGTLGAGYRLSERASLFVEGKYADSMDVGATSQSVSAGIRAAW
jgi:autotransporter-associated beta strand protein